MHVFRSIDASTGWRRLCFCTFWAHRSLLLKTQGNQVYLLNCTDLGHNSRITNALVKLIQDPNQDDSLTSVWGQPWICCVSSTHSTRSTRTGPSTGAMTAEQHKTLNFIRRSYRGHCCCLLSGARPFWKRYCRLRGHFNDDANKGSAVSARWQKCWSAADNAASTLSVRFKAVSLLCTWAAQCVGMLHSGTGPKTRLSHWGWK